MSLQEILLRKAEEYDIGSIEGARAFLLEMDRLGVVDVSDGKRMVSIDVIPDDAVCRSAAAVYEGIKNKVKTTLELTQ